MFNAVRKTNIYAARKSVRTGFRLLKIEVKISIEFQTDRIICLGDLSKVIDAIKNRLLVNPIFTDKEENNTALHAAAQGGNLKMLKLVEFI